MQTNEWIWKVCLVLLIAGIVLYFVYKHMYERNLNRALRKVKVRKLPGIKVMLSIYIGICLLLIICLYNYGSMSNTICVQDTYFPGIMYEGTEKRLHDQLSQWITEQNDLQLTKTDLHDRFEGIVGVAKDGNFTVFLTYRLHGLDAGDEVTATIKDLHDGSTSTWSSVSQTGNDEPLQNGLKIYAYTHGDMRDFTCTKVSFEFDIKVKNHPELSASKKIKLVFKNDSTISIIDE